MLNYLLHCITFEEYFKSFWNHKFIIVLVCTFIKRYPVKYYM